jgi:hypothetical protein
LLLDERTYELALNAGHKAEGATFNRFGIWNQHTTGDGTELYFDDLVVTARSTSGGSIRRPSETTTSRRTSDSSGTSAGC